MSAGERVRTADDVEVAFTTRGSGRTIVFLHGICESHRSWEPVISRLTSDFCCIAFDFRGHGDSTRLSRYEPGGFITDLGALIDATCDDAPVVVGHSLGGIIATVAGALGMTGPVVSIDQPLRQGPFARLVHSLASRLRNPSSFADALMEEKIALGMDLVPEPMFTELERMTRTCDQAVVLDTWAPMLDGDTQSLAAMDDAIHGVVSSLRTPYLALHGGPLERGTTSGSETSCQEPNWRSGLVLGTGCISPTRRDSSIGSKHSPLLPDRAVSADRHGSSRRRVPTRRFR